MQYSEACLRVYFSIKRIIVDGFQKHVLGVNICVQQNTFGYRLQGAM